MEVRTACPLGWQRRRASDSARAHRGSVCVCTGHPADSHVRGYRWRRPQPGPWGDGGGGTAVRDCAHHRAGAHRAHDGRRPQDQVLASAARHRLRRHRRHPCRVCILLTALVYDILAGSVSYSQHWFTTSLQGRYTTHSIGLRHPYMVGIPLQPVYDILAGSVSHSKRFTASMQGRYPTPNGLQHPCMVSTPLQTVYGILGGSVSHSQHRFTTSL